MWSATNIFEGAHMDQDGAGPQVDDRGTAGVLVRPPRLFLAVLLLGLGLDRVLPFSMGAHEGGRLHGIIAGSLLLVGLALATAGIRNFGRAGTPVPTIEPTRALATTGIYGLSRNPIYLGMFLIYGGIGLGARSIWTLILALPLAVTIRYGVIAREEEYLERRFGDVYRAYKSRVRRWL
jgi:protein-S-isoprenylcysteine O-methyltransferase Ste14